MASSKFCQLNGKYTDPARSCLYENFLIFLHVKFIK